MTMNIKYRRLSIVVALAALFTATSASAALTVTIGGNGNPTGTYGEKSITPGAVTTDFNASLLNPAGYTGGAVKNGTSSGNWAEPPGDTSNYFTVGPSTSTPGILTLSRLASYFGFYGGSPDAYNSIEFFNGNNLIQSFSGSQLATLAGVSNTGDQAIGKFWNFTATSSAYYFNKVEFFSTQNAYETDNHAVILTAVPEPETYAMMLAGLGLIGFMVRRKNVA